jgi:hypothetical protein
MSCGGGVHFLVHSWSNICHLGCQSAVLIAIRAALTMLDRSLRERHVLKNNIDAFPQPTIQPTKCDVLYDLRSVWQSPHVCQVVVIPNPAVLSRQRSRVSSSPPFLSITCKELAISVMVQYGPFRPLPFPFLTPSPQLFAVLRAFAPQRHLHPHPKSTSHLHRSASKRASKSRRYGSH